jgi:hypothetical protein
MAKARTGIFCASSIALVAGVLGCGGGGLGLPSIFVPLTINEQKIPGYTPPSLQSTCAVNLSGTGVLSPDSFQPVSLSVKHSKELQGESAVGFLTVKLDKVTLNIIPPSQAGQTWDFLDSIKLFADVPGQNKPPVLVAELSPVPRGQTAIVIKGTGADIADIASADNFEVTGQVSGRPPCADVHFNGEADFKVSL